MRNFATEFTVIGRCDYSIAHTDLFSVDLVVALGGDVECLFSSYSSTSIKSSKRKVFDWRL